MNTDTTSPLRHALTSFVALWLLCLPLLSLAAPRAWLDRDSIRMGETVTLNVETDARGGSEPDFSELDANFRRLGTSSSTQLSIVNGRQSARTLWAVALEPRQEGVLAIPALIVGNETTEALSLTVLPMPTGGSAAAGDEIYLEVEAEPAAPYVQQQVRYVVRLYYAVTLLEGQLEEPQVDGAQLRRLGQDLQYQKTLSERRYNVVERRYALLPEVSGRVTIPGPKFRGRALRAAGYGQRGSNAILSAQGDAVELDVRPRPAPASGAWLPAWSLSLHDEGVAGTTEMKVGEPITLTLRLTAQGLAAEQLPELTLPALDGAEVYPDQDTSQTRDDGQWLLGERVRKFAIVPTRAGTLSIPEVAIDWWDVANDRRARAVLPAREWTIATAAGAPASADRAESERPELADEGANPGPPIDAAPNAGWWPVATLAFAALWLATLLWRRRAMSPSLTPAQDSARRGVETTPSSRALQDALRAGAAPAIAKALLALGRGRDGHHLGDVAMLLDDPAQRDAVIALERALYRDGPDAALLENLRRCFAKGPHWRAPATVASSSDRLPPLYRDR